ncbi:hypothetical protein bcgnr5390_12210 [Bacillus luti]|nr:hypothetical protein BC2903_50890 [Bacillus cereus]
MNAIAGVAHVMTIHVCVEVNATRIRVNAVIHAVNRFDIVDVINKKKHRLSTVFYFFSL